MNLTLIGLVAGITGNTAAVVALGLRLRWKAVRHKEHRIQMVELVHALPERSSAESRADHGGIHTRVTIGGRDR
ncbi:hypothetical protein [Nocardia otitidiscaviarum]|uniref:hypothetical protein n=1 Tax=Nocardia otitidiscaviarum TaxID=1823 RepID=UPI001895A095|nr:hypothetical protein [Nocardia otitidiscaviarum]MBF6183386.1 hypothetical protein [Nocardia otitidiscaviarum]